MFSAMISNAIKATGRQMLLSLSPGTNATPAQALSIAFYANQYRITSVYLVRPQTYRRKFRHVFMAPI